FCQRLLVRVGRWGSMRMPHVQPLVELCRKTCHGDSKELVGLLMPLAHDWLEEIRERFRSDGHDGGTGALLWLERAPKAQGPPPDD
ncbi:MAG: hypothetical protein KDF64_06195, partial [Geminicoccaceae bacterium]|nr:hypothetical protein [Geminicoccaceae bacterium]